MSRKLDSFIKWTGDASKTCFEAAKALAALGVGILGLFIWHDYHAAHRQSTPAPIPVVQPKPQAVQQANPAKWDGNPNHPDCSPEGHPDPNHPGAIISDRYSDACPEAKP